MKYIRKFDDKDAIQTICESFVDGISTPCSFYIKKIGNDLGYDIYFNFKQPIDTSEFNKKKKSFEDRLNNLGYKISYKTVYGQSFKQSEPITHTDRKGRHFPIPSILVHITR